ncbi:cysteine peptidase family C39 domain-containing protein, partial [Vibrio owensii]|uniref:cysteine peptidase family C39 domain-containing protein n=1 Tax=Vibrio owensii TaxID=696485 RepID=UPI004067AE1E
MLKLDISQDSISSSGVACATLLMQLVGVTPAEPTETTEDVATLEILPLKKQLRTLSKANQVQIKLRRLKLKSLESQHFPLAFKQKNGCYVVLAHLSDEQALLQVIGEDNPRIISREALTEQWSGDVIQVLGPALRFDVSWF